MSGYYTITVNMEHKGSDNWTSTSQLPTFYLHENVQGITSESHAEQIARDIVDNLSMPGVVYHVTAVKL